MKNFSILLILLVALACTTASAQTQQPAVQKKEVKSKSVTHKPSHEQNATVAPGQTNAPATNDKIIEGPALNDAIINVKDEKQYQKKKEQEKKKQEKTDAPK